MRMRAGQPLRRLAVREEPMKNFVLRGNLCTSRTKDSLSWIPHGYVVCEDGRSAGMFAELPERFRQWPLLDWGDCLILPGLVDLHIHAPQYAFRGTGMDLELLEWLNERAFPEEARYQDLDYAREAYGIFAENMKFSATARACIFATRHREATELLMDLMEATGLRTMVGKVNMDRNCPENLREGMEESIDETRRWLSDIEGKYDHTEPILTPRFIPACSDAVMRGLGDIRRETGLAVQSHLSENQDEAAWVRELCPWAGCYGEAYDGFGMFGGSCASGSPAGKGGSCAPGGSAGKGSPTVMAHCVWPSGEETKLIKERGVFVAHCPQSNTNLCSGIAPVREYLEEGISVGLGTDVAAGCGESIFRAMADAIQVSKLRWKLAEGAGRPLTLEEAFFLGTKGGGAFFGKAGSLEAGYDFDALVVDDRSLSRPGGLSLRERLERVVYLAEGQSLRAKYVEGREIFVR